VLNDKDVVGIMAAIIWVHLIDGGNEDDAVEVAYSIHTKAAERVRQGETPKSPPSA
jgi:hypothetical protein